MVEKEKIEVEIRSERIIPIFRGELPSTHQIAVTFQPVGVPIPRTIWILAEDVFKEETYKFLVEHREKNGPLFDKWVEFRAAKIREDIEKQRVFKPEKVSV
ncbi:unnamed protein product [marine sediment metagenome]|uniref:Uncharacterized protein n=1 Tax=marine sediment metagenome TaxID=412755 RepID=X1VE68_9ZZZZ